MNMQPDPNLRSIELGKVPDYTAQLSMPAAFLSPASEIQISSVIDGCFVLSGPIERDIKYSHRLERTVGRIRDLGLPTPEILSGEPSEADLLENGIDLAADIPGRFVSGLVHQRGAAFKHIRALREIVGRNMAAALVCEDDVLFDSSFHERFAEFWPTVPTDADIVYLGFANPMREFEDTLTEVSKGVWSGAFWCLHCALITNDGAKKILDALPMLDQIDFFYGRLAAEGKINAYAPRYLNEELELSGRCAYTARGFAYQERD